MKVTILGCGSSGGTPLVGVGWGAADPENPRNRRLRPSILVQNGATTVLVDTSPDLRAQLLAAGIERLDAVIYTHAHADHLHGLDDLRPLNRAMKADIPVYADAATIAEIKARFGYVLEPLPEGTDFYWKPVLVPHEIGPGSAFRIGDVSVLAFDQDHGIAGRTLGLRFGAIAYTTDAQALPEDSFAALEGVDTWIVGALGTDAHPTHAHVDKALEWIARVGPRRAVLTHMSHLLDYDTLAARLPAGVEPAFDGLVIEA